MNAVIALKNYALRTGLIDETEERWAVNTILDTLRCDALPEIEVAPDARKPVIAAMAEKAFGVHVLAVKTANMKGGLRYIRGTRRAVTEATWKKAIVTVKQGERIELA